MLGWGVVARALALRGRGAAAAHACEERPVPRGAAGGAHASRSRACRSARGGGGGGGAHARWETSIPVLLALPGWRESWEGLWEDQDQSSFPFSTGWIAGEQGLGRE